MNDSNSLDVLFEVAVYVKYLYFMEYPTMEF